jgi:hypothetical protein
MHRVCVVSMTDAKDLDPGSDAHHHGLKCPRHPPTPSDRAALIYVVYMYAAVDVRTTFRTAAVASCWVGGRKKACTERRSMQLLRRAAALFIPLCRGVVVSLCWIDRIDRLRTRQGGGRSSKGLACLLTPRSSSKQESKSTRGSTSSSSASTHTHTTALARSLVAPFTAGSRSNHHPRRAIPHAHYIPPAHARACMHFFPFPLPPPPPPCCGGWQDCDGRRIADWPPHPSPDQTIFPPTII